MKKPKEQKPQEPQVVEDWGYLLPSALAPLHKHQWHCIHGLTNHPEGVAWHREQIIRAFWPQYEIDPWFRRRIQAFSESNWCAWHGPGGCGKTTHAAAIAMQWWLEAPHASAVIACSTSIKMLRRRIWAQLSKFHAELPPNTFGPGYGALIDSDTMIRWQEGDTRNAIFGMAVEEGPVDEVINNLIGIHTHRVLLVLDECQGVREAILKATRNMAKNPVFKFLAVGNPERYLDPLGRICEPIGGWDSIQHRETDTWEIHPGPALGKGRCDSFIGTRSPAYLDEGFAKRNPWMINRQQIEQDLKAARGNVNDPKYQSQTIGWWPDMGLENTVLDHAICTSGKVKERAIWTDGFRQWAALDPAYEGGDRKVLKIGRFGQATDQKMQGEDGVWNAARKSRWVIEVRETIDVPVDGNDKTTPIHYQIVQFVKNACLQRGITSGFFALDCSGEGGGLKAIFDTEWGAVLGVEFGGKPSDEPVNAGDGRLCSEMYDRKATELLLQVREFAVSNGLRGLNDQTIKELCARRTEYRGKKLSVEPKGSRLVGGVRVKGFKDRLGYSPDESDALAVGVALCRTHGAVAAIELADVKADDTVEGLPVDDDGFYSEENYINDQLAEIAGY